MSLKLPPADSPLFIAYRPWSKAIPVFYVESVKGRIGDWGYTTKADNAAHLTPAQCARFASDCRYCGAKAQFIPIMPGDPLK